MAADSQALRVPSGFLHFLLKESPFAHGSMPLLHSLQVLPQHRELREATGTGSGGSGEIHAVVFSFSGWLGHRWLLGRKKTIKESRTVRVL